MLFFLTGSMIHKVIVYLEYLKTVPKPKKLLKDSDCIFVFNKCLNDYAPKFSSQTP